MENKQDTPNEFILKSERRVIGFVFKTSKKRYSVLSVTIH